MRKFSLVLIMIMMLVSGCDSFAGLLETPSESPPVATTDTPPQVVVPTPTSLPSDKIIIWVDPIFSPDPETESGQLLLERISRFEANHPGITVSIRIKARGGQAGMLETLSTVGAAAPGLQPDLVTLNPDLLHLAYLRGLITTLDNLYQDPVEPDWFNFAVESTRVDNHFVSVPIGAEAHAFVYRLDRYETRPDSWVSILEGSAPLVFPAGDPDAQLTLALYQASGGGFRNEENAPLLQAPMLSEILSLYASARSAGLVPSSVRELTSSEETWDLFHEGRAGIALAPVSSFLNEHNPDLEAMIPIPLTDATGLTIAETWGWSVTTQDRARQQLVLELLAWLSDPDFTGPWTEALGLLPASRTARENWQDRSRVSLANLLIPTSRGILPSQILETFGPAVQPAVLSVVDGSATADIASEEAALKINTP
jgi:ABC-type glycerol-3-phosphate transport system substrate-binding protein